MPTLWNVSQALDKLFRQMTRMTRITIWKICVRMRNLRIQKGIARKTLRKTGKTIRVPGKTIQLATKHFYFGTKHCLFAGKIFCPWTKHCCYMQNTLVWSRTRWFLPKTLLFWNKTLLFWCKKKRLWTKTLLFRFKTQHLWINSLHLCAKNPGEFHPNKFYFGRERLAQAATECPGPRHQCPKMKPRNCTRSFETPLCLGGEKACLFNQPPRHEDTKFCQRWSQIKFVLIRAIRVTVLCLGDLVVGWLPNRCKK